MAYRLGLLGALHRMRNRRHLTVFMFHRVLPSQSVEFARAEREFTMSIEGFERTLDFIERHYNAVSLADVKLAAAGFARLPDRAALITFDDGWRDTFVHALPSLRSRGLSAVMFVPSSVPGSVGDRWWHDALVEALTLPGASSTLWDELARAGHATTDGTRTDAALIAAFAAVPESTRSEWIGQLLAPGHWARQMIREGELMLAQEQGLDIGAHGHTHAPLTAVADARSEVVQSIQMLQWVRANASGPPCMAMSFPHGAWNAALHELARSAGFDLVFTSAPCLGRSDDPALSTQALGRIHIPESEWTCDEGRISFPRLATFLFFRPISVSST